MNAERKARELGWEIKRVTSGAPIEFHVRRIGWHTTGGPPADTHFARGHKDLQTLLKALEDGESTDRWRE